MKLHEIFDDKYYDEMQHQIAANAPEQQTSETSMQDFIISTFEAGEMSYDQALEQLKQNTPPDQMFFWEHELAMAAELLKDNPAA